MITSASCILEDIPACKTDGTISVYIKDKNYENIDEIDGALKLDENLPFSSYITDLTIWRRAEGDKTGESFKAEMPGNSKHITIPQSYLKYGNNELVLIGNENIQEQWDGITARELHPGATEYADIYIGGKQVFSPSYEDTAIWMFRSKGRLLIIPDRFPPEIASAEVTIKDVYRTIGPGMTYSGSTQIVKKFTTAPGRVLGISSAPSISPANISQVKIVLTKKDGTTTSLSNIGTSIQRNRISVIRPIYNPDTGKWTLEMLVDGNWIQTDNLHID